jgi:hypothetical protein
MREIVAGNKTKNDEIKTIVTLSEEGINTYRLYSTIDDMEDYNVLLEAQEKEALQCFRVLQEKYFGKIINNGGFDDNVCGSN